MSIETLVLVLLFGIGLFLPWLASAWLRLGARNEAGLVEPIDWRTVIHSMLAYVLAFNITFFIQELFLVLPKSMIPGVQATLYHNNHSWTGDAAIAELFQGTGALAILVTGLLSGWVAARQKRPSFILLWLAFHGLFQSLPQFIVGAFEPGNDMGRAYDYLVIGTAGETALALLALAAMPLAGRWLAPAFLRTSWRPGQVETSRQRAAYSWRIAGLPGLAAIPLVVLYRVPREPIEVLASPILVPLFGYGWLLLMSFRAKAQPGWPGPPGGLVPLQIGCIILLGIFQLVLRPGITF